MAYETAKHLQEQVKMETMNVNMGGSGGGEAYQTTNRNPLICYVCQDYYNEPCLLQCYHTFCARCLRGRDMDGKVTCPLCGQLTLLRDAPLPPPDLLMSQLMELANSENPPCSNCDVRDRNNMYYCNTCGQALCNHCRENTHRAKMFSTHEVLHMSKCAKEPKKCPIHGEQYIMFSNALKTMLCVNCFRDTAAEQRSFCIDIDTAYNQATKRLDRAQGVRTENFDPPHEPKGINELQNSIRDGLIMFKNLLDELRQNMDSEKHTINTFCQGMQEAIAKTHSNMIMEVQRQFETKEKVFRTQIATLGSVLPTLQLHLLLCATFANAANKFQFLELAYIMFDRLNAVSQLSHPLRPVQSSTIRTNYRNEFAQSLEPWVGKSVLNTIDPVPTDVTYDSSTKPQPGPRDPAQPGHQSSTFSHPTKKQQNMLRMKLMEDESPFSNHCRTFESQIKELCQQLTGVKERLGDLHRDVTVLRRENLPPLTIRYECVARDCSLLDENLERHLNEMDRLKLVFDTIWEEQLCRIHVEQEIFHSQISDIVMLRNELKHLSTVAHQLEPYIKNQGNDDVAGSAASVLGTQQHLQSLLEHIGLLQLENYHLKSECKLHPAGTSTNVTDGSAIGDTIPVRESSRSKTRPITGDLATGRRAIPAAGSSVDPQTTEQKRNVISQLIDKVNRKKSPTDEQRGGHQTCSNISCMKDRERSKSTSCVQQGHIPSAQQIKDKAKSGPKAATSVLQQTTGATIERLESHIKEKIHDMLNRRQSKIFEMAPPDGILTTTSSGGKSQKSVEELPGQKFPKSIDIQMDSAMQHDFASLVHRKLSKNDLEKLALFSQSKVLESKKIGKSCDRINELKALKVAQSSEGGGQPSQSKYSHKRSKTPDNSQRFRSKTPENTQSGSQRIKTSEKSSEKYRAKTPPDGSGIIGRGCKSNTESEYQHISEATSSLKSSKSKYKQNRSTPCSPKGGSRKPKVYPFSDGEDAAEFYRHQKSCEHDEGDSQSREDIHMSSKHKDFDSHLCGTIKKSPQSSQPRQNSFESLSTLSLNSRRSSLDNADKTLVLVIGTRNKNGSSKSLSKPTTPGQTPKSHSKGDKSSSKKSDKSNEFSVKQRSWETFPPKKHRNNGNRSYHYCQFTDAKDVATFPDRKESVPSKSRRDIVVDLEPTTKLPPSLKRSSGQSKTGGTNSSAARAQVSRPSSKRVLSHRQQMLAERGYFSEYELDFDTDNPDDDDMNDNVFDFDNELNLTFDRRPSKGRKAEFQSTYSREYPGHMSTFKGEGQLSTFKGESSHLGGFKDGQSHLGGFKSDKSSHSALSTFKPESAPSALSTFKGESSASSAVGQGHMSTFKGDGGTQFRQFQGYFKGESSQSLSSYEPRQAGIPGEGGMKKADSFEGHEEAVRTLVAAVQETRTAAARKPK